MQLCELQFTKRATLPWKQERIINELRKGERGARGSKERVVKARQRRSSWIGDRGWWGESVTNKETRGQKEKGRVKRKGGSDAVHEAERGRINETSKLRHPASTNAVIYLVRKPIRFQSPSPPPFRLCSLFEFANSYSGVHQRNQTYRFCRNASASCGKLLNATNTERWYFFR